MTTTSSPAASNSSNASSSLWASSSMNMVIILATLLCVLIFPLGLYSILRCLLHCARRLSSSSPVPSSASSSSPAPAGLKRKALRRIPVEVYDADSSAAMAECAICLGEFAAGRRCACSRDAAMGSTSAASMPGSPPTPPAPTAVPPSWSLTPASEPEKKTPEEEDDYGRAVN